MIVVVVLISSIELPAQPPALHAASSGQPWLPPVTVEAGWGAAGRYNSMAIVDGHPAISYYDETSNVPVYVRATDADGTAWGDPVVVAPDGGIPRAESLDVVNGRPAISYIAGGALMFVRALDAAGLVWGEPVTITEAANYPELSLEVVNGNPAVAFYRDYKPMYVRAADANGGTWGTPIYVDAAPAMSLWSINLKVVQGAPSVGYVANGQSQREVRYVRATDGDGVNWSAPIAVSEPGGTPEFFSMALVNGRPAMTYNTMEGQLKFVRASNAAGTAWGTPKILDDQAPTSYHGRYNRLAVVNGNPAVSYWDAVTGGLRYIRATDANGANWDAPIPANAGPDMDNSLVLVNGRPALAFLRAGTSYDLMFARAEDGSGDNWPDAAVVDPGGGSAGSASSLAEVDGKAAIAYVEEFSPGWIISHIKYVRALDTTGTAWAAPVTVDGTGYATYPDLALVNGRPAICYSNNGLKYVRATDALGDTWGAPLTVAPSMSGCSLTSIMGRPAIAYSANGLYFVRSLDANGDAWGEPILVDSEVNGFLGLAVIDGKPAVAYTQSTIDFMRNERSYEVRYVQATSGNGATWSTPLVLDTLRTSLWSPGGGMVARSLMAINGFPAISYYRNSDASGGEVRYMRAADVDGTTWGPYVTAGATAGSVWTADLVAAGGYPAVAYIFGGTLYYVQSADGNGDSWDAALPVDSPVKSGQVSMNIVAGLPAISYPGSLRYVSQRTDLPIGGLFAVNSSPTVQGATTLFTATVESGENVAYAWDFGDGSTAAGATASNVYSAVGLYTAVVTASNGVGLVVATTPVTVTDVPIADLTATNSSPTVLGGTTLFTSTIAAGSNAAYAWDFGDGSTAAGATASHPYPVVGLYTAVVTASNGVGSVVATTPVTITDVPIADLTATNSSPTVLGGTTLFTSTIAAGSNAAYAWDFGDGSTAGGATASHLYSAVGLYTAVVTASNGAGSVVAATPVTITQEVESSALYLPFCSK